MKIKKSKVVAVIAVICLAVSQIIPVSFANAPIGMEQRSQAQIRTKPALEEQPSGVSAVDRDLSQESPVAQGEAKMSLGGILGGGLGDLFDDVSSALFGHNAVEFLKDAAKDIVSLAKKSWTAAGHALLKVQKEEINVLKASHETAIEALKASGGTKAQVKALAKKQKAEAEKLVDATKAARKALEASEKAQRKALDQAVKDLDKAQEKAMKALKKANGTKAQIAALKKAQKEEMEAFECSQKAARAALKEYKV